MSAITRTSTFLAPAAVGTTVGTLLVLLATQATPMLAAAGLAGLIVAGVIVAFPYWGFLLTAAVVPLERIGRFTDDSSMTTISLMRLVGTLALGAVLLHLFMRRKKIVITLPAVLYTAYFGVGLLTLAHTTDFEFGVRSSFAILGNLLFFLLVVNIVSRPAHARAAVVCWLLTTTGIGIFTIYQWHNPSAVITEDRFNSTGERSSDERFSTVLSDQSEYQLLDGTPRALGTSSHPAVYAINLILTLPFFAYAYRTVRHPAIRLLIAAAGAIACYNVVLANTRAALLTMAVVLVLLATMRLVRVTAAGVGALVLACAIAAPIVPGAIWDRVLDVNNYTLDRSETLRARLTYWSEALDMLSENWLLGIGIGNQTALPRRLSERMHMPPNSTVHNEYLQSLLETGVLGYPLLVAFVVVLYRRSRHAEQMFAAGGAPADALLLRASRLALLAVLIYGLQVDVLHFPLKGWWLAMGIVAALWEHRPRQAAPAGVAGRNGL